ncbi:MAG: hypothetical protein ACI9QC_000058 [Oceanicoccus sp.]|jgi:hypothetical protein
MRNPEFKQAFETIIPLLYKLIYVIPGMLVPAAIAIYFFDGKNLVQFLTLNAFAVVLYFVLKALVIFTEKQVEKM